MRGLEIGPTVDEFLEAANGYCRQLTELRGRYHRLHVAKYDNLPCAPMYIIERQGRFERAHSSYFLSKSTDYFPHFEWKAPSEFGEDMLKYVKQKWKSYEAEDQPANSTARPPEYGHPALGCWLYTLEFNAHPETKVYGKFFIHKDDEVLRAEGEAFYFGKPPDRAQRRGMWRSRSVEMLEGRRGMNIMYDMLIQSGPLGAPGAHYVGEMKFRDTDFHNRVVSGEFFARGVEHRGNVWVRRLPHLAQRIPPDVSFQEHLWEAFHTYFDGVEICPKELLRHKSTARDSVSSPIASSRS
jgi:hypothetical protein